MVWQVNTKRENGRIANHATCRCFFSSSAFALSSPDNWPESRSFRFDRTLPRFKRGDGHFLRNPKIPFRLYQYRAERDFATHAKPIEQSYARLFYRGLAPAEPVRIEQAKL
jgi:hypothetical protein